MKDHALSHPTPWSIGDLRARCASRLTLDLLWRVAPVAMLLIIFNLTVIYPNDFWWHLRAGQIIVETRSIPTTDLFSFTQAGEPLVNQAWLMQVAFYLLYEAGGLPLIVLAHAITITVGYTLVLRTVIQEYGVRIGAIATAVGVVIGASSTGVRPQSISFLAFGVLLYLIDRHRRGSTRLLWLAVPLFALWVNSHGGFIFGIAVLGIYVGGQLWKFWQAGMPEQKDSEIKQLAAVGVLSLDVLALNPRGPTGVIEHVYGLVAGPAASQFRTEVAPLVIRDWTGVFFFASLLLLAVGINRADVRLRTDQLLTLLLFAGLALWAEPVAAWYGFVLIPILTEVLHANWRQRRPLSRGTPWLNGLLLAVLIAAVLACLPWWRSTLQPDRRTFIGTMTSVSATEFLCQAVPDNARVMPGSSLC